MDRVFFITGVSSGLGRALAELWLREGVSVMGVSRRSPADLIARGLRYAAADLLDHEATAAALHQLLEDVPRVRLAVLNAGVLAPFGDMSDSSLDTMRRVTEVNLWSNKTVLDAVFNGGRKVDQVVAVSSGASVNGNRGWNAYSISKAALNMMIKLYAKERPETHFTALAPGLVDTPMQDELCEIPADRRYPALDVLRSKRGTTEMPSAADVAFRISELVAQLPSLVESGEYVDIRHLPNG